MNEITKCTRCGEPLPPGETMFNFHGYSGPCPKPPIAPKLEQQEQAGFTVSRDFLKRVQESLSDYCGELDWGNADMELMDEVEAMIVAAPKGEKP